MSEEVPALPDYRALRQAFIAAADQRNAILTSGLHPSRGAKGEPLFVDAALTGPGDASRGLIVVSGVHGIEGWLGSSVQARHLTQARQSGVAVLYIHLLNPWGVSWGRRVNEDNVDVNRNFVDFNAGLPQNGAYLENFRFVERSPRDSRWDTLVHDVEDWIARDGYVAVGEALTKGQYQRSEGLFFGGAAPSWSRTVAEKLIGEFSATKHTVALLDIHTGLGSWGSCQVIVEGGNAPELATGKAHHVVAGDAASVSAKLSGTLSGGIDQLARARRSVGMVAEFGTLPPRQVLRALQADHWRWTKGDLPEAESCEIDRLMEAAFCPQDQEWRLATTSACLELIDSWIKTLETAEGIP